MMMMKMFIITRSMLFKHGIFTHHAIMPSWPSLIFEDLYFGKIGVSKQQFPAAGSILMAVASASGRQPPVPDALGGVKQRVKQRVLGVDSRYYIHDIGNYLLYLTISVMILIDIIIIGDVSSM